MKMRIALYLILVAAVFGVSALIWLPEREATPPKVREANKLLGEAWTRYHKAKQSGNTAEIEEKRSQLKEALEHKRAAYIECFPDQTLIPSAEFKDE